MESRGSCFTGGSAMHFYGGYVTVNDEKHRALFYYFVEAEIDPASKPLVLWLNGGPGCSSLGVGAFSENGPFRPNGKVLVRNECSWNREANMLYLETPVGVGFSYATNSSSYVAVDDEATARDNVVFLQRWFNKFPQYRHRDLFITGESYAGHYIPQLAKLMIEINRKKEKLFHLKGIALGNPVLEFATDFNSRAEYLWSHGLISDSTYKMFTAACNYSRFQVSERIDVCVDDETMNYLNRKDVQKALHARLVGVGKWEVCSNIVDYELLNLEIPTISVGSLIKARITVLVYSGDQDSVIPLTGSRTLVHRLAKDLGLNTTVPYRAWFAGKQVGGWTQVYGEILSFATIRGASHEAHTRSLRDHWCYSSHFLKVNIYQKFSDVLDKEEERELDLGSNEPDTPLPLTVTSRVLYMLGDITTGPAHRFAQWLELVRKKREISHLWVPSQPSRTSKHALWVFHLPLLSFFIAIKGLIHGKAGMTLSFFMSPQLSFSAGDFLVDAKSDPPPEHAPEISLWERLGKAAVLDIEPSSFSWQCSLHSTTLSIVVALNNPRMK
ncbi:hypothetical protein GH714_024639 [Hevea brasiliensis]|uniref:Carboxypeptidase n=1 Tax=Hevea brasiliensis TaxID=3981 RepID=A0A6A6MD00_HEVBR|nr:hypothetical protein GH714_024639 [Hevea brasiliensis]